MNIYNYSPNTGEFLGAEIADADPLEAGKFLIPAHATTVQPPSVGDGFAACFVAGAWLAVEDHRGATSWDKQTQEPKVVEDLGAVPSGFTLATPPNFPAIYDDEFGWVEDVGKVAVMVRSQRAALLRESDWTQLPDAPLALKSAWAEYRAQLRDLPNQEGFPSNVVWPVAPQLGPDDAD